MSIATNQVEVGASPNYEVIWCSIGDWCRYVNGWEFTKLRNLVRYSSGATDDQLVAALAKLERLEAQRNRDVANLQIEWIESRVQRRLPRALVWLAIGVFGLAFWACATLKLLELVGYVFVR